MKNTHLEHPEDAILTGDLSVIDWFATHSVNDKLSVKIDGAPAIVWGTDPETGKFFVGTKSVFNKVKIKINYSHEDIDINHGNVPNVANILHVAFDYLPHINGVVQGDFIGFGGDDTYRPNTITYSFNRRVSQEFIIAPHTSYSGSTLKDAIASFEIPELKSDDNVLFVKPDVYFCGNFTEVFTLCKFAKQMSSLVTFASEKEATEIKKAVNLLIKCGEDLDAEVLSEMTGADVHLFNFYNLVIRIKDSFMSLLHTDDELMCYVNDEECEHEGYVRSNKFGTYKLVNRHEFSHYNFVLEKAW
jgi:hypothetical protein